jgi:hypothetical protein
LFAFNVVVPKWQDAKIRCNNGFNGLRAMDYFKLLDEVKGSTCAAIVVVTVSDMVCDIELCIRAALNPRELRDFERRYYTNLTEIESEVFRTEQEGRLDYTARVKVGRELLRRRVDPLVVYNRPVDVRGRKRKDGTYL